MPEIGPATSPEDNAGNTRTAVLPSRGRSRRIKRWAALAVVAAAAVTASMQAGAFASGSDDDSSGPGPAAAGTLLNNDRWNNGPASADPEDRDFLPFCGNKVYSKLVKSTERDVSEKGTDDTLLERVAGKLVITFINPTTHKSITIDASGPYTQVTRPDKSVSFIGQGNTISVLGPRSQRELGRLGLGLALSDGETDLVLSPDPKDGVLIGRLFSVTGRLTNLCTVLS